MEAQISNKECLTWLQDRSKKGFITEGESKRTHRFLDGQVFDKAYDILSKFQRNVKCSIKTWYVQF